MALLDLGRRREAQDQLRATIDAHPDLEEAYLSLGRMLEQQGEREGAAAVYRRLLARNPGHAEAAGRLRALAPQP
jgi:tetratricopeptide (TPR) repeat protein